MAINMPRHAVVLLVLWTLLLAACTTPPQASDGSPAPAGQSVSGDLKVMVPDLGSERMDPTLAGTRDGGHFYGRLLHGFLVARADTGALVPGIASAWSTSADGLTLTFTIRKGVKFHDGAEVTPEDVKWSLEHAIGPKAVEWATANQVRNAAKNVTKIEIAPPDKVTLTTKAPDPGLIYLISESSTLWIGAVLPRRASLHDEKEEESYDRAPIGAGPMKFVAHSAGTSMKFERFDDYYYQPQNGLSEDRRMNFQSLELLAVPELATRVSALRAGQADIISAATTVQSQIEAAGGRLAYAPESLGLVARTYGCWDAQYPCHDRRVREAFGYALDKSQIQKVLGGPEAFVIKGWPVVGPSTVGYSPALDPLPFDPNKAKQLFAEAGYPDGKGFGKLIVHTFTSIEVPLQVETALVAADSWRKVLGLDVEVRAVDPQRLTELELGGAFNGTLVWRPHPIRVDAVSAVVNFFASPTSSQMFHKDEKLIDTVKKATAVLDPEKRVEALRALYAQLATEHYWIGAGYTNNAWGTGARVSAWQPWSLTLYPSALHTVRLK